MLKKLFQKLLISSGKEYVVDTAIPDRLICSFVFGRVVMVVRGFIKTRRKIFLGKQVNILNTKNFTFGKSCTIERNVKIDCYSKDKITFGEVVKIGAYSTISTTSHMSKYGKGLSIGNNSAIGEYSYLGCSGGVEIGNDVIMGQYISFHSENHNFSDSSKLIREQGVTSKGIKLGDNIWVGSKVTFLDGCSVGNNSVVAAGAVVNGIFPENVIIGGVPAKVIKAL
ncbi:MAG: acyltransferase [Winogradskyella sp.]|uniref:acyltransferase n=1 Tax=Winogradskyella sp. TaxID=1883156 RepID=UPI0025FAE942|nr:acyltransferase [Winogradskyella sp.]NRB59547.1 acyltransferase [Winogradskyella sp.]